jgi:diguanylate cyclase (GGDEF)-like protein
LGLIMADIDHFKEINNTYGHAAGDFALCEFANRLAAMLRHSDYLGRYGGEEFLLLVGETSVDELTQIADGFRLAIADMPFELGTASRRITASFGLVLVSEFSEPEAVIAVADRALYAAKTSGRNCCVLAL